jgi:chorismate synthase
VKAVEIGMGLRAAAARGSDVHDEIFYDEQGDPRKKRFYRKTNHAGGIEGGMTNGEDVVLRVACKPISTLNKPLRSVDVTTRKPVEAMVERTDNCIVPALAVITEAVAALELADVFLCKFGSDNLAEIARHFESYLHTDL